MTSFRRPLPALTGPGRRARWRRSLLRRLLAAACAAGAIWLLVSELRPAPPPSARVVMAAARVDAGGVLTDADLTTSSVPASAVPPGALTEVADAVGRRIAGALEPGEWLTRTRLVPRTPSEGLSRGRVALHVNLADPFAADVVHVGQGVLVVPAVGGEVLSRRAVVLAVDPPAVEGVPEIGAPVPSRGLVLALPPGEAERVLSGHGGLEGRVVVNVVATGSS